MQQELRLILQQLEVEKSLDRKTLVEAIRSAVESAARKSYSKNANITVEIDPDTLQFKVFEILTVVGEVEDPALEMSLADAHALNPHAEVGNRLKVPTEPRDFGRIAAQTARQVMIQKIKDAERSNVFEEFKNRQGELITGLVKRISHGNVMVSIGRAEAVLPHREQSPREGFKPGDRIRAYLLEVEKGARGPQVILSRTAPELVRLLFDLEVPEIYDGTIEIKAVAREAGNRTKVAVSSNDPNVDPVGACVGMKGSRVRTVVEELSGEKIDIVRWSRDPAEFCANALNPADIIDISVDEASKSILVVVPHDQLSLAIGKRGQNARLASRLIGWNIDIRSDVELTSQDDESAPEPAPEGPVEPLPASVVGPVPEGMIEPTLDATAEPAPEVGTESAADDLEELLPEGLVEKPPADEVEVAHDERVEPVSEDEAGPVSERQD